MTGKFFDPLVSISMLFLTFLRVMAKKVQCLETLDEVRSIRRKVLGMFKIWKANIRNNYKVCAFSMVAIGTCTCRIQFHEVNQTGFSA